MKIGTKSQFPVLFILFSFVSLCCCEEYTFENSTIGLPNKNVRNVSLSITRADDYVEDASANDFCWKDSAILQICFHCQDNIVIGQAVYGKETNNWSLVIEYDHPIVEIGTCDIYYFEGVYRKEGDVLVFNDADSPIYASYNNQYDVLDNGDISISAVLKPILGRIRFQGNDSTLFSIEKIKVCRGYNFRTNELIFENNSVTKVVQSNGFSSYVYGCLDENQTDFAVRIGQNSFSRAISKDVLRSGSSGYMKLPNNNPVQGWYSTTLPDSIVITVDTISFTMKLIEGGSFLMGADKSMSNFINEVWEGWGYEYNEYPCHEVSLNSFYIAKTEVSQALWEYVMGYNPSRHLYPRGMDGMPLEQLPSGPNYPVDSISWNQSVEFISKLNTISGRIFRLPTEAEWEYAARGGRLSKRNFYAVSDETIGKGKVFPYAQTSMHEVEYQMPNELGLYEMSGNVAEFCQDWYSVYPNERVVAPVGPRIGSRKVVRGGFYLEHSLYLRVTSRSSCDPNEIDHYYDYGFRLAL